MTRDATEFLAYSVTADDIADFKALGDALEVFPTDDWYLGNVSIATEDKDAKADALRLAIRSISVRAENKWGPNSARYKQFRVTGMNKFNDRDLLVCARHVHYVGTQYLTDLASEGLTQTILDNFLALAEEFEQSMNAQIDAVAQRDIKTEERVVMGNELYSYVVKYCNIGKQIWENVNEAKYNDYVIYVGGGGGGTPEVPPPAPVLNYAPNEFYWDEVSTATSYQLVYKLTTDTEWIELYAGPFPSGSIAFNPGEGEWIARLRARNSAGYGDWSEEVTVFIGLRPPQNVNLIFLGAPDNHLRLSWEPVIGADTNDIYKSVVNLGQPSETFTLAGSIPTSPFEEVATLGKRYYYYIVAKNAIYTSEPSLTVFFDVPV